MRRRMLKEVEIGREMYPLMYVEVIFSYSCVLNTNSGNNYRHTINKKYFCKYKKLCNKYMYIQLLYKIY